ncbi:hypothetical protein D3C76_508720 [compost metagenome]
MLNNFLRLPGALSALALVAFCTPLSALATEGALGRPVSGTGVSPNIGVVPAEPMWIANLSHIHFDGSLSNSKAVPIGGSVGVGISASLEFTLATLMKVWETTPGRWNYASSLTVPYLSTEAEGQFALGRFSSNNKQSADGVFDLYFAPVIAGYHFSQTEHMALSFNIWAPTGDYDPDRLANTGLNVWTFVPQLAYTLMLPTEGLQLDAVTALQFYTRNDDTDYTNAPLFTLDLMARKLWGNGIGAGIVVGTVQQLGDDKGDIADSLDGFRGRDWAAGPIVTYDTKLGSSSVSLGLRWVPTVSSEKRLDSDSTVMGSATLVF